ncbi:hypothetical protein B0T20DRAFT_416302 [Sordaria brevicollis]|uniref:Uncharacterized protein n=1 Tax=Sordaria brevicollis TaxID=83679 RepID=A0AAE0P9X1_SORBR|nr:hypothetical protein B0T20DRAFT_416302 [Sordaria brevicollis]
MSRNRYTTTPRPPYIVFDRDWNPNLPLAVQAQGLIRVYTAAGVSKKALLHDQRDCRDRSPAGTLIYNFHNALVAELTAMTPSSLL